MIELYISLKIFLHSDIIMSSLFSDNLYITNIFFLSHSVDMRRLSSLEAIEEHALEAQQNVPEDNQSKEWMLPKVYKDQYIVKRTCNIMSKYLRKIKKKSAHLSR